VNGESSSVWKDIASEYITGDLSLRALARQHGLSGRRVMERCRVENWVEQRRAWRDKTSAKIQQKSGEKISEESSEIGALVFRIGKLILQRFLLALRDGGLKLSASDAERWAKILLEMETSSAEKSLTVRHHLDFSQLSDGELDRIIARVNHGPRDQPNDSHRGDASASS